MTAEFYPDYPDPLPAFQYIGGDYGRGLLESALAAPQHTADGRYLARTVFDKAALLFRSLVKNHAMVDGNKRLALTTATVFLYLNGYVLTAATQDAIGFTLGVAAGPANPDVIPISRWFRRNSIRFETMLAASPQDRQELARAMRVSVAIIGQQIDQVRRELDRRLGPP